ncbi:MAG: hypothetical protein JOZ12_10560 [Sinobacteraceae bacterium]|nr:hypothetical protein [Nevskiaceae bacterium]
MSSARLRALEARRLVLLGRCEEQRLELAYRLSQLRPRAQLTAWSRRRAAGGGGPNPLAFVLGVASLLMMLRRKKGKKGSARGAVPGVGWAAGIMALASRTTSLLRLIAQVRALYAGLRAARRARGTAAEVRE